MIKANKDTSKNIQSSSSSTPVKEVGKKEGSASVLKCSCGAVLRIQPELAGKKARCAGCGKILNIPSQAQIMDLFQAKLQKKIVALAKKLEEEQAEFQKSFDGKETEIKTLQARFIKEENNWAVDKKRLDKEIASLKSNSVKEKTDWQKKAKEYEEEIVKSKNQSADNETKARQAEINTGKIKREWEDQIAQLEKDYQKQLVELRQQLTDKETEFKALQTELTKNKKEWEDKVIHSEKDHQTKMQRLETLQTKLIDEELENLDKRLAEERLIWREKMAKEKSTG